MIRSTYLKEIYQPEVYKKLYSKVRSVVNKEWKEKAFEAIAFSGSSGAAIAYPVCLSLGIPMIHIRKQKGHCHSFVEGALNVKEYAIIDDLAFTGSTLKKIKKAVESSTLTDSQCSRIFLYSQPYSEAESRRVLNIFDGEPAIWFYSLDDGQTV